MNGKTTNFKIAAVGVATLVLGFLGGSVVVATSIFSSQKKGVITISKDAKNHEVYDCAQTVNGDKDAYPHLNRPFIGIGGNTITWTGVNLNGAPTTNVDVVFPSGGTPFSQVDFHHGQDSGTIVNRAPAKDYPFATVTVDGTPCSQFVDPGVHANQ